MKEESLLLLSDLQKLINQVVLIDYTIIILGVEFMCQEMEQIYYEGEKSGELKARKETAMLLVEDGMDISRIARLMKVTEQDIHEWIDESMCIAK